MVYDEIDPFSDMLVEVSGTVPFIKLEYPDISGDPFLMENVKYEAAKTDGLSNGDVVTITATASKTALKAAKKVFSRTTMQYTVEGQPFYLTPDTVLNDEQMAALRSCMDTLVEAAFLNGGEDVQHGAQGYLYGDAWKYWGSEPTATLVSCDNLEAVVFPASGGDPGYVEFLANATVTFCANQAMPSRKPLAPACASQASTLKCRETILPSGRFPTFPLPKIRRRPSCLCGKRTRPVKRSPSLPPNKHQAPGEVHCFTGGFSFRRFVVSSILLIPVHCLQKWRVFFAAATDDCIPGSLRYYVIMT